MGGLVFFHDNSYKGSGLSEGLARGLQVQLDGEDLTQEGMGLGAIAVRAGGYTYFARSSEVSWIDNENLVLNCILDTVHVSSRNGASSPLITRVRELMVVFYRRLPAFQKPLLWLGTNLRRTLGITGTFAPAPPLAQAQFCFQINNHTLEISCDFQAFSETIDEVYIMNELGADYFDSGWQAGAVTPSPSGWEALHETRAFPFLYSSNHHWRYSIGDINVEQDLPFAVYWGREQTADLRWAGFIIQLQPSFFPLSGRICRYTLRFVKGP